MPDNIKPIGVFDSGYGGLTVLKEFLDDFPEYDFIYLGDNARNPYGSRSFEVVYEYTLQAVKKLFEMGCHLVILACNTASAKALRSIQQLDLPSIAPNRRVLGVIRPAIEAVREISQNGHIGILGTKGTVASESYPIELQKWAGEVVCQTSQEACPMWVPIVENNEINSPGAELFVKKNMENLIQKDPLIDTIILACTHYPLLIPVIKKHVPDGIYILDQGKIVSLKLADYLTRHPEIDQHCTKNGVVRYYTTENTDVFEQHAGYFINRKIKVSRISL